MAVIDKHTLGSFCWPELATSDSKAAKAFYSNLFGWTPDDMPMNGGVYTMLKLEGRELGALHDMAPEQRTQGIPPNWLVYVAVESVDRTADLAGQLGGGTLAGPLDVFDAGRMAVLRDPQGAALGVWQAKNHIGARIGGVAGTLTWSELATTDAAAARTFYAGLFGWGDKIGQTGPLEYTEWINLGQPVGGMLQMTEEWHGAPPHWMPYFLVGDCDASAAKATELGGRTFVPPTDIPNVGRFGMLADPQGAMFSIIRLTMQR